MINFQLLHSHSSVHSNAFLWVLKNGKHLSMARETNQFMVATLPVRLWTSFIVFGDVSSKMALTLSRFASIPHYDTMNSKNLPEETPKTHLVGFNFMLYLQCVLKVFLRSSRCSSSALLFISMLSNYHIVCGRPIHYQEINFLGYLGQISSYNDGQCNNPIEVLYLVTYEIYKK